MTGTKLWKPQIEAKQAIYEAFDRGDHSTVAQLATGCGKTTLGAEIIDSWDGSRYGVSDRVLWLVHMDRLVEQAASRIVDYTGWPVDIEKGGEFSVGLPIVVGTVQTMYKKSRRNKFPPHHFGLVVYDECHHAPSKENKAILDYFSGRQLGLTATLDRGDSTPLSTVFDSVCYSYPLWKAIQEGVLVPLRQQYAEITSLTFDDVNSNGADLNQTQLTTKLELKDNIKALCKTAKDFAGDRATIIFCVSVDQAQRCADYMNEVYGPCAGHVNGYMNDDERFKQINAFEKRKTQFLFNCQLLTEGVDFPWVSCIIMGRPTKVRSLYEQMVGRGVRAFPGKTDCLVVDLVKNSRHSLVTTMDLFYQGSDKEVLERAKKKKADQPEKPDQECIEEAEAEVAFERMIRDSRVEIKEAGYRVYDIDPFAVWPLAAAGISDGKVSEFSYEPPTEGMVKYLMKQGMNPASMSRREAEDMIREIKTREVIGLATYKQSKKLQEKGYDASTMTLEEASDIISQPYFFQRRKKKT